MTCVVLKAQRTTRGRVIHTIVKCKTTLAAATARLARGGRTYARGSIRRGSVTLQASGPRRLRGTFTLTLRSADGRTVLARRAITIA